MASTLEHQEKNNKINPRGKREEREIRTISIKLKTENQEKINKMKMSFFDNINKIGKPSAGITEKKREDTSY